MIFARHERIAFMEARWYQLQGIILERAKSPEMRGIPVFRVPFAATSL
jgi:hypothetical protein